MNESPRTRKLIEAYDRMMERVKADLDALEHAEQQGLSNIKRFIDQAAHKAVELGELSQEEARMVGDYLKRDLADAGHHLATTNEDLAAWLRLDLELIEDRILDLFRSAADQTRLEMLSFEESLERASHYYTGEVTGPGSLRCDECGKQLQFHRTGHIPPCPACHGTRYSRLGDEEAQDTE